MNVKITIESYPIHSPENAECDRLVWNINNSEDAAEMIEHQKRVHLRKSRAFKIYKNDQLIFEHKTTSDGKENKDTPNT